MATSTKPVKMVYDSAAGTASVKEMTLIDYALTAVHPNESAVGLVKIGQQIAVGVSGAAIKAKQILGTYNPFAKNV